MKGVVMSVVITNETSLQLLLHGDEDFPDSLNRQINELT